MFHILSGWNFLRKRKLLSRDRSAHTAKRMCPTEPCTSGETRHEHTRVKVVISCSTFSNADHGYGGDTFRIQPIRPRYIHGDWRRPTNYSGRVICFRGTHCAHGRVRSLPDDDSRTTAEHVICFRGTQTVPVAAQWTIDTTAKNRIANYSGYFQVPVRATGH